jgi:perosamine synthetase
MPLADTILAAIKSVIGANPASLHEPSFTGNEWTYVKDCLDSGFVSSVGKFVDKFEDGLCAFTGARHAIAVSNGTSALHIALKLVGVQTNDEVLLPTLTFVATANAVAYCNAIPHFVDAELDGLGIDTGKLREYLMTATEQRSGQCINRHSGRVIRALLPMHTFGHPSDLDGLMAIAKDFNVTLVEDAAESLGSYYKDKHTGTFGAVGTLSFNGNKTITTGGGGAILTNDPFLAKRAKHLTTTAKMAHRWEYRHDEIGYNYRMPNLNAALGCAQLEQLPELIHHQRVLHKRYAEAMRNVAGAKLVNEPLNCHSNFWLQALLLDESCSSERDHILNVTNAADIMTRPVWDLLHQLPMYDDTPRMDLSRAEAIARRLINIPSSPSLVRRQNG